MIGKYFYLYVYLSNFIFHVDIFYWVSLIILKLMEKKYNSVSYIFV